MEESEGLFREIGKLDEGLEEIKKAEMKTVEEMKGMVLTVLTMEKILPVNDPRTSQAQKEVETKAQTVRNARDTNRAKRSKVCKQLEALTVPEIRKGRERLEFERSTFSKSLKKEIISQRYEPISKKTMLKVSTNEDALRQVREKISESITALDQMRFRPVSEIRSFIEKVRNEIVKIDVTQTTIKEIDETVFYKDKVPLGNLKSGYDGPLTSLKY